MNKLIILFSFLLTGQFLNAQNIEWITWEEVEQKMQEEPKKVIVDVFTEWCGWCKKMDASTFQNPEIIDYINEYYYAIKFDAEHKETIVLKGEEYEYLRSGKRGYNELAAFILRGKLSYPSLVFLDEELNVIQPIPGYRDAKTLIMILNFFDGDYHKNMPWKVYSEQYKNKNKAMQKECNPVQTQPVSSKGNE